MAFLGKLFSGKSTKERIGLEREYKEGDIIVKEGDMGSELFLIKKGSVSVLKKSDNQDIVLSVLDQGEFFGEMAIFEKMPRSATVKANERTLVQVIFPGSFLMSIRQDPTLVFDILRKMSKRVRILNEEVTRLHSLLEKQGIKDQDVHKGEVL